MKEFLISTVKFNTLLWGAGLLLAWFLRYQQAPVFLIILMLAGIPFLLWMMVYAVVCFFFMCLMHSDKSYIALIKYTVVSTLVHSMGMLLVWGINMVVCDFLFGAIHIGP
jgi:hypothetical protein